MSNFVLWLICVMVTSFTLGFMLASLFGVVGALIAIPLSGVGSYLATGWLNNCRLFQRPEERLMNLRTIWWSIEDRFPDFYHHNMAEFYLWRRETFIGFYNWKDAYKQRKALKKHFGFIPQVGTLVEDCREQVHPIAEISDDLDTVTLDDGFTCSLLACCDLPKNCFIERVNNG